MFEFHPQHSISCQTPIHGVVTRLIVSLHSTFTHDPSPIAHHQPTIHRPPANPLIPNALRNGLFCRPKRPISRSGLGRFAFRFGSFRLAVQPISHSGLFFSALPQIGFRLFAVCFPSCVFIFPPLPPLSPRCPGTTNQGSRAALPACRFYCLLRQSFPIFRLISFLCSIFVERFCSAWQSKRRSLAATFFSQRMPCAGNC